MFPEKEDIERITNQASKIGASVILAVFLVGSSVYTIESGYVGVLKTFGKYNPDEIEPGLHFKVPVAQSVTQFDVKLHAANYKGRKDLPDKEGVVNKPAIRVLDSKNLPIGIELTVQYTPIKDQASEILAQYGKNYFDKLINPLIRDVVRDVAGKYRAEDIARDRAKIATEITDGLKEKFKKIPFVLNDVLLRDIKLPPVVVKKIEEVQLAKQEEQKLAMVEKQALKRQKIKTIEANTKLIEITTKAKAEAERKKIEADAKAYQIQKEAEAQAKANEILSRSLTPELVEYIKATRWNGKLPQVVTEGSSPILLQKKIEK